MSLRHPFLSLDVPDTFEKVRPQGTVSFQWEHALGAHLLVTIGLRPPSPDFDARRELEIHMTRSLADKPAGMALVSEPKWVDDGRIVSVTYALEDSAADQGSMVRIATTKAPMVPPADLGLTHLVHPLVRIALYAPASELAAFEGIFTSAVIAPFHLAPNATTGARDFSDDLDHVFPYLITDQYIADRDGALVATERAPQGSAGLTRAGGGLWLALVHDFGERLRVLFPADVARAGLDWDDCMKRAQANLRTRVGTEELPLGLVDVPEPPALLPQLAPWRVPHFRVDGMPAFKMLVVGESWLAASCLFAPDLRAGAAEALGTDRLLALAPHRDRLFVFADRGQAANAEVVEQILAIEKDAEKPLSPALFRLEPTGPREIPPS